MKIAVIGAGAGGLTAAYDLQKLGHQVHIFERESGPGGLAAGFREENWDWSLEKFYHHWFKKDTDILSLIEELGLGENVIFKQPKTVVLHEGGFYPLDSAAAVMRFPGFSLPDKLRFGLITAYLKYTARWEPLEKYTAVNWIRKYYGENLYKIFFRPLLAGKFSRDFEKVNMAWFWARFKARTAQLGTYRGGFQAFLDDFAGILEKNGVTLHFDTAIDSIKPAGGGLEISYEGKTILYDQVLATISPKLTARLAPDLDAGYKEQIENLESIGAVVVIYSLKEQLSKEGYYWFNLDKTAGYPFLALVEHTNYLSEQFFGGEHLVYCGDYVESSHEYFSLEDGDLIDTFTPILKKINTNFSEKWINRTWVFRAPYAQPVPPVNHSKNIPAIRTPLDGLFLASMSQVYPWDRGTNFAVQLARKAVREMSAN